MAMADDDVTIEPGTYGPLTTTLTDTGNTLTIHGQAGAARPVISFSTAGQGFNLTGAGTSLSNVEADITGSGVGILASGFDINVDRVIGHAFGADSYGCLLVGMVTLTNSVCVADGFGTVVRGRGHLGC